MNDISFVPIAVLGLVVYTLTNLLKYLRNQEWSSVVTLLAAWLVGFLAVWLVGATTWGQAITVGGSQTLNALSFVEKLLVGLVVTSVGSFAYDLKRSFDGSDSAVTPPLVPPKAGG